MNMFEARKKEINHLQQEITAYLKAGETLSSEKLARLSDLLKMYLDKIKQLVFKIESGKFTEAQEKTFSNLEEVVKKVHEGENVNANVMMFLQESVQLYINHVKKKIKRDEAVAG